MDDDDDGDYYGLNIDNDKLIISLYKTNNERQKHNSFNIKIFVEFHIKKNEKKCRQSQRELLRMAHKKKRWEIEKLMDNR